MNMRKWLVVFAAVVLCYLLLFRSKQNVEQLDVHLRMSGARKALDFMTDARAYPEAAIPEFGMAPAFDFSKTKLRKGSRTEDLSSWRAIGPRNIGGRTLDIAFNPMNPNTIYAGSASGGLWRSHSGGAGENAWEYVPTGFPVLGVASIAISPEDSNVIYIGTGEVYGNPEVTRGITGDRTTRGSYGIGILKTTDGGQTWRKSLDWFLNQRRGVQRLRINPMRTSTVWAATTEGTYVSYDAGLSWEKVHEVIMATDLAINANDTSTVFVACGGMGSSGHGIYRTQNGGQSWQKMLLNGNEFFTFNGKIRLAMSPSDPNIVYASIGKSSGSLFKGESTGTWLFRTIDGGDTWELRSTEDYSRIQGWYAHDVAVHPTNPDEVWCAGQGFFPFLSTTGGLNLQPLNQLGFFMPTPETSARGLNESWADFHDIVFHPTDPQTIYFANDGGVFRTTDGGLTAENCNLGYQTTQFYNGTSSSFSDSLFTLGGMQDNNSAAYEGHFEWRRLFGGDGSWTAIDQTDNDIIYVSYQFLSMGKSENRGSGGFQNVSPQNDQALTNFIAPFILSPVDNQTLYAGSQLVHKSSDGGNIWIDTNNDAPLDGNSLVALAGSFQDVDVVYAATSPNQSRGHIFRTTNGGLTWQDITGNLPDRFPTDLAVDPNSDRNVCVTFGGFGSSHVFQSDDRGDTWVDIGESLPDVPTWAVILDPLFPERIYVGNDLGVYFSPDDGTTWQEHFLGLPDAIIAMDLTISPSNRVLRVATHGNGFFETPLIELPPTSVTEEPVVVPMTLTLQQNYPNPFNLETKISYYLSKNSEIEIAVFNSRGQKVRRLMQGSQGRGWHDVVWDGKNDAGEVIASGVYLYRLVTREESQVRKMLVIK